MRGKKTPHKSKTNKRKIRIIPFLCLLKKKCPSPPHRNIYSLVMLQIQEEQFSSMETIYGSCYPPVLPGLCACLSFLPFPSMFSLTVFKLFSEPKAGIFYSRRWWILWLFISSASSPNSAHLPQWYPPFQLLGLFPLLSQQAWHQSRIQTTKLTIFLFHSGRGELDVHYPHFTHTRFTFLGTQRSHLSWPTCTQVQCRTAFHPRNVRELARSRLGPGSQKHRFSPLFLFPHLQPDHTRGMSKSQSGRSTDP